MLSEKYILERFKEHSPKDQIDILSKAIDFMKEYNRRKKADCISLAMGIPIFPKVYSIEGIAGYIITLKFTHGEVRTVNFQKFFDKERKFEKILLKDYEKFQEVEVSEGTLFWPSVGITSKDVEGQEHFYPYDIDPGLLYEYSSPIALKEV